MNKPNQPLDLSTLTKEQTQTLRNCYQYIRTRATWLRAQAGENVPRKEHAEEENQHGRQPQPTTTSDTRRT